MQTPVLEARPVCLLSPSIEYQHLTSYVATQPRLLNGLQRAFSLSVTMDSRDEVTLPATRPQKSRKSISHLPSTDSMDKENMTTDLGGLGVTKRTGLGERPSKKSRSKSIGPGGLDALKDGTGNRRKVELHIYQVKACFANLILVYYRTCSKINPQTYDASSSRNSGAYRNAQAKSEESTAITGKGDWS